MNKTFKEKFSEFVSDVVILICDVLHLGMTILAVAFVIVNGAIESILFVALASAFVYYAIYGLRKAYSLKPAKKAVPKKTGSKKATRGISVFDEPIS